MPSVTDLTPPSLDDMAATRERLAPYVLRTPVAEWRSARTEAGFGPDARVMMKLELLQRTGTFKPRGAINNLLALRAKRVTAVSAGNHAIAVAYAAKTLGADAKVVMIRSANPARVQAAKDLGAEVVTAGTAAEAFDTVEDISKTEDRVFIHPFEGRRVTEATAGVALEFLEDASPLDAVVVAIGGGGLASGVAAGIKAKAPHCAVYGVEPETADVMRKSLSAGAPQHLAVNTIADSLGAPMTTPYAFAMAQHFLDDVVTVTDDQMAEAMLWQFQETKLALEPAGAAAAAAAFGPLRERLRGKRIGLIVCGANIDRESFCRLLERGAGVADASSAPASLPPPRI